MLSGTWRGRAEWATLVLVIFTAGYIAQAPAANGDDQKVKDIDSEDQPAVKVIKKMVQLRDKGEGADSVMIVQASTDMPSHFLGIHGAEVDPILRKHLKLDGDQGILVIEIFKGSPADKAGLEKHDILLTANGKKLARLDDLVETIREGEGDEITLQLIRAGEKMSCTVKPEKRPEHDGKHGTGGVPGFDTDAMKDLRVWVEKLQRNKELPPGVPDVLRLRTLGPGVIFEGRSLDLSKMPGNLSISIAKKDNEPAKIKIEQNDKTWEFQADDAKAIEQLPEDVREFIQPMFDQAGHFKLKAERLSLDPPGVWKHLQIPKLTLEKMEDSQGKISELPKGMMERIEQMEKKIEELHNNLQQLHNEEEEDQ